MQSVPVLREELDLLPGPVLPDGQPSWTLHDPMRNLFFRIDWPSFRLLRHWDEKDPARVAELASTGTTLTLDEHDVAELAQFLVNNQLVRPETGADASRKLAEKLQAMQGSLWTWLLHHYLFFRIPLLRPDRWLERYLPVARSLQSQTFALITLAALLLGLFQVVRQWDVFVAQLVDVFNLDGLLAYALALVFVKVFHELGHAFTAKRFGCRVPSMGVAFVVLWPMAYTDTNEVWRLTNARQRLLVASAGIVTELGIAAWATLAWALLPDGGLRSAAFVLATTSWVTTLLINASPFMRFDGYFILSDALDAPNLHERCFALARWKLREWLFGIGEDPPEIAPAPRMRWMIGFAWVTWIYRLVVFLGIAVLVYQLFFKLLGIILFVVEIGWFILRPLKHEMQAWRRRSQLIAQSGRTWISLMLLLAIVSLLFVPWPGRISASALLRPAEVWPVHAPHGARLDLLAFLDSQPVPEGATVARFYMPDLQTRKRALAARVEQLRWQAEASVFDEASRIRVQSAREALATALTELAAVDAELRESTPVSPFAGRFTLIDPDLHAGQWITRREKIGQIVRDGTAWTVETWLDENDAARVRPGDRAMFATDGAAGPVLPLTVRAVDRDASRSLPRAELSATAGGHILVREKNGQLVPERAIYRVTLAPDDPQALEQLAPFSWRGHVSIHAAAQAPGFRYLRQAASVLVREFGF